MHVKKEHSQAKVTQLKEGLKMDAKARRDSLNYGAMMDAPGAVAGGRGTINNKVCNCCKQRGHKTKKSKKCTHNPANPNYVGNAVANAFVEEGPATQATD